MMESVSKKVRDEKDIPIFVATTRVYDEREGYEFISYKELRSMEKVDMIRRFPRGCTLYIIIDERMFSCEELMNVLYPIVYFLHSIDLNLILDTRDVIKLAFEYENS
jgi:hypothetical protein